MRIEARVESEWKRERNAVNLDFGEERNIFLRGKALCLYIAPSCLCKYLEREQSRSRNPHRTSCVTLIRLSGPNHYTSYLLWIIFIKGKILGIMRSCGLPRMQRLDSSEVKCMHSRYSTVKASQVRGPLHYAKRLIFALMLTDDTFCWYMVR